MASAGFEPTNLGTRGQHANHLTTEAAQTVFNVNTKSCNARSMQEPTCASTIKEISTFSQAGSNKILTNKDNPKDHNLNI
jgi:hypothetical protein